MCKLAISPNSLLVYSNTHNPVKRLYEKFKLHSKENAKHDMKDINTRRCKNIMVPQANVLRILGKHDFEVIFYYLTCDHPTVLY